MVQLVKNPLGNARDTRDVGLDPWVGKISWSRKWQPTLVFLPGESHGQRGLASYSSWSFKELDTTEHTHTVIRDVGHIFMYLFVICVSFSEKHSFSSCVHS